METAYEKKILLYAKEYAQILKGINIPTSPESGRIEAAPFRALLGDKIIERHNAFIKRIKNSPQWREEESNEPAFIEKCVPSF